MKNVKETFRLEIISHERTLPEIITQLYGVPSRIVAESKFFTIFALETHVAGDDDPGFELLDSLKIQQQIVAWSWSRPIMIEGYSGDEFIKDVLGK